MGPNHGSDVADSALPIGMTVGDHGVGARCWGPWAASRGVSLAK